MAADRAIAYATATSEGPPHTWAEPSDRDALGWLFGALGISTPIGGMGGTIFVAFIGAVVLLFVLRLIRGSTRKV